MKRRPVGPFLAAAAFCRRIEAAPGGPLSLQDVIASIALDAPPPGEPPLVIQCWLWVAFWRGDFTGTKQLTITATAPNGHWACVARQQISFAGELQLVDFRFQMHQPTPVPGLYWYSVCLDNTELTRAALDVRFLDGRSPRH